MRLRKNKKSPKFNPWDFEAYTQKPENSLHICHGSIHSIKYEYTLDINKETKPLIVGDISNQYLNLSKYYNYFDKAVLEYCPYDVYSIDKGMSGDSAFTHFEAKLQTFLNIYKILKKNGLLYIPNWILIEEYSTLKNYKQTISIFLEPIKTLFKFKERIVYDKVGYFDITLVLQKI
jgi:hypothetical protein